VHTSPLFAAQQNGIPGEAGTGSPTTASTAGDGSGSAAAPSGGMAGCMGGQSMMFIILIPMMIFLFWSSRNANKKQKALETGLKIGDRVITKAGMAGKVTELNERFVKVELAPGVGVQFLKTAIEGVDTGDPKKDEAKKDEAKKEESKDAKKDEASAKDAKKDEASAKDAKKDDVESKKDAKKDVGKKEEARA